MDEEPETVAQLTGNEGGVWRIVTQGSSHIMDLDAWTVIRVPGPGRPATFNDVVRPLRSLEACAVGAEGRWTMLSDDELIHFYWHVTSNIRRIERVSENTGSSEEQANDED